VRISGIDAAPCSQLEITPAPVAQFWIKLSSSFPRTIFRVPVALADFLTQNVQHDTEPRTQNAAQQAVTQNIYELSDFEKQKGRRNAAKIINLKYANQRKSSAAELSAEQQE
jgi:hypothetical protein